MWLSTSFVHFVGTIIAGDNLNVFVVIMLVGISCLQGKGAELLIWKTESKIAFDRYKQKITFTYVLWSNSLWRKFNIIPKDKVFWTMAAVGEK